MSQRKPYTITPSVWRSFPGRSETVFGDSVEEACAHAVKNLAPSRRYVYSISEGYADPGKDAGADVPIPFEFTRLAANMSLVQRETYLRAEAYRAVINRLIEVYEEAEERQHIEWSDIDDIVEAAREAKKGDPAAPKRAEPPVTMCAQLLDFVEMVARLDPSDDDDADGPSDTEVTLIHRARKLVGGAS